MEARAHLGRSRWAAIGAAVAVTIGGGIAITNAVGEGAPSAFVPITPCRLFDTRADQSVGPRKTALTAGETFVQQVTGTNGNCTIPAGTQGIASNVTIVNGTAPSFLTVWPSDATRPLASNLNWVGNTQPTPNKVDVKLSTDGKVSFYNNGGTVDVVVDIVGYYSAIGGGGGEPKRVIVDQAAFSTDGIDPLTHDFDDGYAAGGNNPTCGLAQVDLPNGVTLTDITGHVTDAVATAGFDVTLKVWRNPITIEAPELMFSKATPTLTGNGNTSLTGTTITSPVIDNSQNSYFVTVCGLGGLNPASNNRLYEVIFNYA